MIKDLRDRDGFAKNVAFVFLGTSVVNFFNLLYQLYVAHRLTPQDFAAFNSLISIYILLSSPLMTLQTAVGKYGAQFRACGGISKVTVLLNGLLKRSLGFALATFLLFFLISGLIFQRLKIPSSASGLILAAIIASSWLTPILWGGLQGQELFLWLTLVLLVTALLKLIFSVVFIHLGMNFSGALLALLLASCVGIALSLLGLRRFLRKPPGKEDVNFREIFIYGLPVAVAFFLFMNLVNMDMILVKYFFTPKASGFYSLAQMIGKVFLYLPLAISMVLLPRASALHAQRLDTAAILKRSLLYASLLCVLALLLFNLFPTFTLKALTGKAFAESVFLGRLFGLSMTFFTLLYLLITYFLAIKDLRFIKYLVIGSLAQFFGIVFFHQNLVQVQAVLCVNAMFLFGIHLALVFKK
ncbi:MAG: oligosaccharide flippase family protein [Candidatus Omnitrophota bacterium]